MDEENKEQKQEEIKETQKAPEKAKEEKQEAEVVEIKQVEEEKQIPEVEKSSEETTQEKKTAEPVQQETKKYETFKPVQENPTKKKGKKGLIISLLVLIVVVVGMCAFYYFGMYTDPQTVYQGMVKDGINALTEKTEEVSTIKAKMKLGLNVELEEDVKELAGEYIDDIVELINKTEIGLEVQMDKDQQQLLYKLDSTYEKDDLIKMNMLIDAKEESAYMELEQFFDEVLKVDMEDEDTFEALRSVFETEKLTLAEEVTQSKALKIINKEVSKMIKKEYCSKEKEKEKIDIDSKEVNVDKYELTMTGEKLVEEITTVVQNLKDNKEYIKCFEDEEATKEELEDVIDTLKDIDVEDSSFTIKLYRKGIKQDTVRIDFEVEADGTVAEAQITKTEEGYKIKMLMNNATVLTATVKEEKDSKTSKLDIKIDIKQVGKIQIKTEASFVTGEKIDTLDTANAVQMEDLTEKDLEEAYKKLENSKLYEVVEKYMDLFDIGEGTTNNNDNVINPSTTTPTTSKENEIETYTGNTKITFSIPVGYTYESNYSSNTLKTFTKGDTDVSISSYYSTPSEYLKSMIDSYKEIYEESEYYSNINISTDKTMQVDGKTFDYAEITYQFFGEEYKELFICTQVNSKEVYTVRVSGTKNLSETEIQDFLKINY